jgi:RNA polymerase sigma-70 factor (ECF subfamily)
MALDRFESKGTEGSRTVLARSASDHQLIELVRSGDESAFGEIIERYRAPLTNYIYRMLGDYEESVDLAQESFVRVYFALDRYHTEYAFSTYIYRIATNLAITEIRRRRRRRLFSLATFFATDDDDKAGEFHPPDGRALPDAELVDAELKTVIEKAITALPDKYRAPIVLRDVQELSYEEVARILGLGLGTTKSRISRARALMREKLKGYLN